MSKKIKYAFMALLVIGALYFGLRFLFGFFTPYNSWTARQDLKEGKIQVIELGELPLNFQVKQELAGSYGFRFSLPGCAVTRDIFNGAGYYNRKVIAHLEARHGQGWWMKFQSRLDSIDRQVKGR